MQNSISTPDWYIDVEMKEQILYFLFFPENKIILLFLLSANTVSLNLAGKGLVMLYYTSAAQTVLCRKPNQLYLSFFSSPVRSTRRAIVVTPVVHVCVCVCVPVPVPVPVTLC